MCSFPYGDVPFLPVQPCNTALHHQDKDLEDELQSLGLPCRHYTFYLWKDFFGAHPVAKFTLVPLYLYSAWSLWRRWAGLSDALVIILLKCPKQTPHLPATAAVPCCHCA